MTLLVYANDGESVYDSFFLNYLLKNNQVYFLTFNEGPISVPKGVRVVEISEPFHPTISPLAGLNAFLGSLLRSILLKQRLSQIKPAVLIGCGGLLYGFYFALSNCSPFILFIWGSDVLVAPRYLPFRFMAKYSLKKAAAVVVDSNVQEKACISLGCDPGKIVKFPWVDLQPILAQVNNNAGYYKRNAENLRRNVEWHEDNPIVISTRHHEPIYNLECLIQAIPRVAKEIPTARFLILGKGGLTQKLKDSVAALGVGSSVKFVGQVPFAEIPKLLRMADIYVSTSLSDGTSASLIEAMTCEIPVIVADIPGNREWIKDGFNGLLFPIKDSEALAERMTRLLKDKNLGKSLAAKAYETVIEKADWQRNSKLLDDLIASMTTLK